MRFVIFIASLSIIVGCGGDGGNQVLAPVPKPEKTDAQWTQEMTQGVVDVNKEMAAGPPK